MSVGGPFTLRKALCSGRHSAGSADYSATVSYVYGIPALRDAWRSREALPLPGLTPYHCHTHLYEVKCTQRVDSQTPHGLLHIHPKMGST